MGWAGLVAALAQEALVAAGLVAGVAREGEHAIAAALAEAGFEGVPERLEGLGVGLEVVLVEGGVPDLADPTDPPVSTPV